MSGTSDTASIVSQSLIWNSSDCSVTVHCCSISETVFQPKYGIGHLELLLIIIIRQNTQTSQYPRTRSLRFGNKIAAEV